MPEKRPGPGPDVRAELQTAAQEQALVRVVRTIRDSDDLDGFVVGFGEAWLLLALFAHDVHLDGHVAVRLADVSEVEVRGGPDTFVGRALAARGEWPPDAVDVDLDGVRELIRTVADVTPLVTLHVEETDPTVCFIGRPVRLASRSVHLLGITPEAEWEDSPDTWAFRGRDADGLRWAVRGGAGTHRRCAPGVAVAVSARPAAARYEELPGARSWHGARDRVREAGCITGDTVM